MNQRGSSAEIHGAALIIAAGGSSSRFAKGNKLLVKLNGKPVFIHAILTAAPLVEETVMAVPENMKKLFAGLINEYLPDAKIRLVNGGVTRTESVSNALKALDARHIKMVAIHDGARPYTTRELFEKCFNKCAETGGALACRKICDTVKSADAHGFVSATLDRSNLWAAETPQVFALKPLLDAYAKAIESGESFTDDCGIMERFSNIKTAIVENREFNGKITFAEDIKQA